MGRVADALEKLVFLLEKLVFPPPPRDVKVIQADLDDLKVVGEEEILKMREEKTEFARRYQVMPDSPAFGQAILDWENQMRNIHGEEWRPPEDWRSILAQAQRQAGIRGEQASSTAEAVEQG
jgi:hypothetical protein